MAIKHELISPVKNGKLQPSTTKYILKYLSTEEGKRVRITMQRVSAKRSIPQNSYLHLLLTIYTNALNDLGNEFSMVQVKELCKTKFPVFEDVVNKETGEIIGKRRLGTSEMNKEQTSTFYDQIIRWAADMFHIILPYPNEQIQAEL